MAGHLAWATNKYCTLHSCAYIHFKYRYISKIPQIWMNFPTCMFHTEPKWQIPFRNCSLEYTAQIWHFPIPLTYLGIKDFRKIMKGHQRLWRSNQRPESQQNQNFNFFSHNWDHLVSLVHRFSDFGVSRSLRPKRPP